MSNFDLTRRSLFPKTLGIAGVASALLNSPPPASASSFESEDLFDGQFRTATQNACSFLDFMMDAYAAGSTVRLIQSYSDQLFGFGFPVAFTYDNAVAIQAYLARGDWDSLARAQILGNGLIHAQATNFPVNDGRFGQAYYVNVPDGSGAYITPAAFPFYFYTSAVGDQAWAGMALAQLYARTRNSAYLTAALKVANWIVNRTYDTAGAGGFRFGEVITPSNTPAPSGNGKSTEHNIDAFAFFTMLATLTGKGSAGNGMSWSSLAQHALAFVEAMFNATGGFFYTGTTGDQITIFKDIVPEDVQTWSYLAFQDLNYGVSIEWVKTHLATTDTPSDPNTALQALGNLRIEGLTFTTASLYGNIGNGSDPHAVWLEGSAHGAAAMISRRLPAKADIAPFRGDLNTARELLSYLAIAQANLGAGQTVNGIAIPPGQGVTASTGNLDTGFGFSYFPRLHIGATGWAALAFLGANPFKLGYCSE